MAPGRGHHAQDRAHLKKTQNHAFKENIPPARETRYISTSALFKAAAPSRVEKRKANTLVPVPSISTTKVGLGKSILTKRPHSPPTLPLVPLKPKSHPLVTDLNYALAEYRDNVTDSSRAALAPVHDALVQRLAGGSEDSSTRALAARFDEAMDLSAAMRRPLGEYEVKVRFRDAKGNATNGQVVLGDTVMRFEKLLDDKRRELDGLWQEWTAVRQEIASLGAGLLGEPSFPVQFGLEASADDAKEPPDPARAGCDESIAALREEIRVVCEKSRKEVAKEAQDETQNRKAKRDQWLDLLKREL